MRFSSEMRRIGRRNFLKAVGGVPVLAALGTTAVFKGPRRGKPVRLALIGYGAQGSTLRNSIDPSDANLVAICDIRPSTKPSADQQQGIKWYQDWRILLHDGSIEAVMIATPLCTHAEIAVACLAAGKHVFCETAMAKDALGCQQMISAGEKSRHLLHIGYQHYYEPLYWAAYHNIMKQGLLGDVYTVEAVCHSDSSGRVKSDPGDANFDPRPWGYDSLEQLLNWRLYQRYSDGLMGEWGGSLVSIIDWFFDAAPTAVQATGGIYSYKDGRDVGDHVYATLEYPNGRTAMLSLIRSNGFEQSYIQFMGTKGTLIIREGESLFFSEDDERPTTVGTVRLGNAPVLDASASRAAEGLSHSRLTQDTAVGQGGMEAFQREIAAFCGAIRAGAPLRCTPAHAYNVTLTCLAVNEAVERKQPVTPQKLAEISQPSPFDADRRRFAHA